ncbi:SDR family oxidoreductase [Gordonia aichiensis]|uniref:SDR family oxidoreductase n=1 Tax=Gordonia aichiensis TaxID=36820 RepID=UPI003264D28A
MQIEDRVAIVTGGGGGIGSAIGAALAARGARVLLADLDGDAAAAAAARINDDHPGRAIAESGDTARTEVIAGLIARAQAEFGPVDMYFANAGITGGPGLDLTEAQWDRVLDVNLRAHIRAAQQLLPGWLERGEGYFITTASAAGLLTQIGSAGYAVSKHAAVSFAEWLSVTYGDRGVRVSCLCPMGVETKLMREGENSGDPLGEAATRAVTSAGDVLTPDQAAATVIEALGDERFLILPHANVRDMYQQKASDYDRWLRGMRRYQASLLATADGPAR